MLERVEKSKTEMVGGIKMAWKHALRRIFTGDDDVKRGGDVYKIEIEAALSSIRAIPGLNPRQGIGEDPDDHALLAAVIDGQEMPAIELLKKEDDSGQWLGIVSGHRRMWAFQKAWMDGAPIKYIKAVLADKKISEDRLLARAMASNQGKPLTPSETGGAFLRLRNFGWTDKEIARSQSVSTGTVSNRIKLVSQVAPKLQSAVDAGEMTQAGAIAIAGKSGSIAEQELALEVSEEGKKTGAVSPSGRRGKTRAAKTPLDKIEKLIGCLDEDDVYAVRILCDKRRNALYDAKKEE